MIQSWVRSFSQGQISQWNECCDSTTPCWVQHEHKCWEVIHLSPAGNATRWMERLIYPYICWNNKPSDSSSPCPMWSSCPRLLCFLCMKSLQLQCMKSLQSLHAAHETVMFFAQVAYLFYRTTWCCLRATLALMCRVWDSSPHSSSNCVFLPDSTPSQCQFGLCLATLPSWGASW